ncbi:transposase [Algiphilus sp. W345]|uniref:Transposase n=1 Tax=Banduia mediterranea TaxID=3075609 RepID=A0ABU2WMR2_9GAMM|nr:transposase [Algiphilus sp. W345]MDT0498820.1 transposase [Algiphilus sp. W345]
MIADLTAQVASLQQQLDWFKRQLFGEKSEKRLDVSSSMQADLLAALEVPTEAIPPAPVDTITYTRRQKQRDPDIVTDSGLHFDASRSGSGGRGQVLRLDAARRSTPRATRLTVE